MIEPMEPTGRWWLVNGTEVDLNDERSGAYPPNVRAAVLARRDATSPEEEDTAAFLEWAIEHDPDSDVAFLLANEFLWTTSQAIHKRLLTQLDNIKKRKEAEA